MAREFMARPAPATRYGGEAGGCKLHPRNWPRSAIVYPAERVEYPFFTRNELSNGIQLADQLVYNVYRVFRRETFDYPYFERLVNNFYRCHKGVALDGLKVWPDNSLLVNDAKGVWEAYKKKTSENREGRDVGLGKTISSP